MDEMTEDILQSPPARSLPPARVDKGGAGTVDIGKAMEGFLTFLPPQMKIFAKIPYCIFC